jgi:hypothetical protein
VTRFIPVSLQIDDDTVERWPDLKVIEWVNREIQSLAIAIQPLDPAQFVAAESHPNVVLKRAGGYDPRLGPDHPDNQDPTLPPRRRTGGKKRRR